MTKKPDEVYRRRIDLALAIGFIVLAIATIALGLIQRSEASAQRECIAQQFHQLTVVLNERSDIATEDKKTLIRMFRKIATSDVPAERRQALQDYLVQQDSIIKQRDEADYPNGVCPK